MTPVRLRLVAPLRTLLAPLRPIIGVASAARRVPVPLRWRKRWSPVADSVPRSLPNRRVDHFHHWSARLEFDWRLGLVAPLATTSTFAPSPVRINSATSASAAIRPAVLSRRAIAGHFDPTPTTRILPQVPPAFRPRNALAISEPSKPAPISRIVRRSALTYVVNKERRLVHHGRTTPQQTVSPDKAYIAPSVRSVSAASVVRRSRRSPAILWIDVPAPVSLVRRRFIRLTAPAIAPLDRAPAAVGLPRRQVRPPLSLTWRAKDDATAAQRVEAAVPARVKASHAMPAMMHSAVEAVPVTTVTRSNAVIASSSSTAAAPDFNRLVDEVMRRIDRHTRSERQRRGL
ncbi:hypothetical protein [Bradyrhizobium sp. 2S1]|uniref:hypothetical protein n=1 Tax=Bradyrhizobium sp. 2S1 TaxID=1404429 RepID=UPI0014077B5D|nr:hypothetical protein [Bradyrhizobium sp. 2S1]MCK7665039.1 hypothetical protein [Bradyrhizobium sp. 2S1]